MSASRAIRPRHELTEIDRVLAAIHGCDDDEDEDGQPIRRVTRSELAPGTSSGPAERVRWALSAIDRAGKADLMSRTRERPAPPDTVVQLSAGVPDTVARYAQDKITRLLHRTAVPVLSSHLRVMREGNPAVELPVVAHANLDLDGRLIQVRAAASLPYEVIDLLIDRMAHRLERAAPGWQARRGRANRKPHNGSKTSPLAEPEIIRHRTASPSPCSVDVAIGELDDLQQDFHLFVEVSRGVDSIVYRAGPTELRLAQVDGHAERVAEGTLPITRSRVPAPLLDVGEAVGRLELTGLPFLFYLDAEHGRGCVLYHRLDGHYGLIDPQAEAVPIDPV
jgi:ribosome-associated translation inhibitor RaiA